MVVGLARYAARQRLDQLSRQRRPDDGGLSYQRVMAPRLDLRGGGGPLASHQTVHVLFLANDRCL